MAAALEGQEAARSDLTSPGRELLQPVSNSPALQGPSRGLLTQIIPQPLDQCCSPIPR